MQGIVGKAECEVIFMCVKKYAGKEDREKAPGSKKDRASKGKKEKTTKHNIVRDVCF